MDRITYISNCAKEITSKDIEDIRLKSIENNARDGLTGALMCFKQVFYQIIEGEPDQLHNCFERIRLDPRHTDIFVLNIQRNIKKRLYPQWSMKTVVLDDNTAPLMSQIRYLLDSLANTHHALKKFAPVEILNGIQKGEQPLKWEMENDEMVVVFSDLVAFSTLVEQARIEDVEDVLSNYFEIALSIINDSGGTISKLNGDGFFAYYPIRFSGVALDAAIRIIATLKSLRENAKSPFLALTYCAFGISAGKVVKGNIGSNVKMDYTVLGDVVNSASRLESYTRETGFSIHFDSRLKDQLPDDLDLSMMEIKSFTPKGMSEELRVYTIDDPNIPFNTSPSEIREKIRAIYH